MTETAKTTDAQVMLPTDTPTVQFAGKSRPVPRIKVKHLNKVMSIIRPFANSLNKSGTTDGRDQIIGLILEHSDGVVDLLALLFEVDRSQVEEADLDTMVEATSAVLEVNLDFFVQKVLPSLLGAMGRLANQFESQAKPLGQTASNT